MPVSLPRRPSHLVPRRRLTDRLDASDAQLIVVRGPAGSGKTALLAEWCDQRRRVGDLLAWVTLTPGAADDEAIWATVEAQLRAAAQPVPVAGSVDSAFAAVTAALAGTAGPPVRVVLDGYRHVRTEAVDAGVADLLRACPRVQVLIGSRVRIGFERLDTAAMLDVECIRPDDLLFTADEADRLVDAIGGEAPPGADGLGDRVLPLAARLAGVARRRGFDERSVAEILLRRQLGDRPPADLLRFLTRISSAVSVEPELARRLTGIDAPEEMFRAIEERGLGSWVGEPPHRRFVLEESIADCLARQHALAAPVERAECLRTLCAWALETGDHPRALRAAVAVGEPHLVSRVVRDGWETLSTASAADTVARLEELGGTVLERFPLIAIVYALALGTLGRHDRGTRYFVLAGRTLRRRGSDDDSAERLLALCAETVAFRLAGDPAASTRAAQEGLQIVQALGRERNGCVPTRVAGICAQFAISLLWGDRTTRALEACALGAALSDPEQVDDRRHCRAVRAFVHAFRGEIGEARATLATLGPPRFDPGPSRSSASLFEALARSLVVLEEGDPRAAELWAERAAGMAWAGHHWAAVACCRAAALLLAGEPERCSAAIEVALGTGRVPRSPSGILQRLIAIRILALWATGNRVPADGLMRELDRARFVGICALRALLEGNAAAAIPQSSQLVRREAAPSVPRDEVLHDLVIAAALLSCGRRAHAAAAARRAVALAAERGLTTPLALLPEGTRQALLTAGGGEGDAPWPFGLRMEPPRPSVRLTRKETLVLHSLGGAMTLESIAREFSVSVNTVKAQTRAIYRKLGVRSRDAALIRAAELGLLVSSSG